MKREPSPTVSRSVSLPALVVTADSEMIDALALAIAARVAELLPVAAADGWLDSREAAAHLRIHYSTLKERAAAGKLPSYQDAPGGPLYFKRSELDEHRRSNGSQG
jgi:excisionase family DNA binding protein